jgi:hypothetical protein
MKIRLGTWIALGAFALLLIGALWWNNRKASIVDTNATPTIAPLWSSTSVKIIRLRVEDGAGDKSIEVARDPNIGWKLISPASPFPDVGRIESAASWLEDPLPLAVIEAPGDLSPFGLDKPNYRIIVSFADGSSRTLDIGRLAPTGGSTYVRFEDAGQVLAFSQYQVTDMTGLVDSPPIVTPTPPATPQASAPPATGLPTAVGESPTSGPAASATPEPSPAASAAP